MHVLHRPDCLPASRQRGCAQCFPIVPTTAGVVFCRHVGRTSGRSQCRPGLSATSVSPAAASCPARSRPSRSCSLCQWSDEEVSISSGSGAVADRARESDGVPCPVCAADVVELSLASMCIDPGRGRTRGAWSGRSTGSGITSMQGQPECSLQSVGCSRTVRPFLSASGVALARISVHVAVARWGEVHRPLLAVSSNTVPCLVPRRSECMHVTAHPSPDPPPSECFH